MISVFVESNNVSARSNYSYDLAAVRDKPDTLRLIKASWDIEP